MPHDSMMAYHALRTAIVKGLLALSVTTPFLSTPPAWDRPAWWTPWRALVLIRAASQHSIIH